MSKQKNYLRGTARKKEFSNGGYVINFSLNVKELRELAAKQNNNGWVNLTITPRQSTDQYGNTHSIYENDFVPNKNKGEPASKSANTEPEDDLPF